MATSRHSQNQRFLPATLLAGWIFALLAIVGVKCRAPKLACKFVFLKTVSCQLRDNCKRVLRNFMKPSNGRIDSCSGTSPSVVRQHRFAHEPRVLTDVESYRFKMASLRKPGRLCTDGSDNNGLNVLTLLPIGRANC